MEYRYLPELGVTFHIHMKNVESTVAKLMWEAFYHWRQLLKDITYCESGRYSERKLVVSLDEFREVWNAEKSANPWEIWIAPWSRVQSDHFLTVCLLPMEARWQNSLSNRRKKSHRAFDLPILLFDAKLDNITATEIRKELALISNAFGYSHFIEEVRELMSLYALFFLITRELDRVLYTHGCEIVTKVSRYREFFEELRRDDQEVYHDFIKITIDSMIRLIRKTGAPLLRPDILKCYCALIDPYVVNARSNSVSESRKRISHKTIPPEIFDVIESYEMLGGLFNQRPKIAMDISYLQACESADISPDHEFVFKRLNDEVWQFRFRNERAVKPHRDGYWYIWAVLDHGHRSGVDVSRLKSGTFSRDRDGSRNISDSREAVVSDLHVSSFLDDPVIDKKGVANIRNEIKKLESLLSVNDFESEQRKLLEGLLAQYKKYVGESTFGGRPKQSQSSGTEKDRKAVSKSIDDAIKSLKMQMPDLANHLQSSIRKGKTVLYAPSGGIDWLR